MSERPQVLVELGEELDRVAPRAIGAPRRRAVNGLPIALPPVIAVAVTLAVAAIALVIPRHPTSRTPATTGSMPPQLLRSFAAFRRARTAADLLTGSAFAASGDFQGYALEPELSRLVLAKPGELVWLVPGPVQPAPTAPPGPSDTGRRAVLCMVIQNQIRSQGTHTRSQTNVEGECAPAAQAARNGLSAPVLPGPGATGPPGPDHVVAVPNEVTVAVLPDGSHAIEAALDRGVSVRLTPNDDGVIQTSFQPFQLRYVSFRGADGKRHTLSYHDQAGLGFQGFFTPPDGPLVDQLTLHATARGTGPIGTARIYKTPRSHLNIIWIDLSHMPVLRTPDVYAAWLYSPPHKSKLLAIIHSGQTRGGELTTYSGLPSHPARFRELLITTERTLSPHKPGPPVLISAWRVP